MNSASLSESEQLNILGDMPPDYQTILTPEAKQFLAQLVQQFAEQRDSLLQQRKECQQQVDAGRLPDFLPETQVIRSSEWTINGIPQDLLDRRVEITGPVDRKMIINALNSDVKVFMADFEDSLSPTWDNLMQGQINLRDAVQRTISFDDPKSGKHYELNDDPAVLICRTRGIHLPEKHIEFAGTPIPGCLLDFALYLFHNAKTLLANGSGPYFYLPKLENHLEARWWNTVFNAAQKALGLEVGTIKCTVLIETLPAVFEMDEILYELKDHIVGLNCGRWDYIFSYIKTLQNHADRILPDRQTVTMEKPFLNAYSRLLIKTCHKRGAFAMGGMAAFIPTKDPKMNAAVFEKIKQDKQLEADNGHDGTWVAHPGLVQIANDVFAEVLTPEVPNQLSITRESDPIITAAELLAPCEGECTEAGMRSNIRIALHYIAAWITGNGCVPIYNLMEDAATAEISRTSIWQWLHHKQALDNGEIVTKALFEKTLAEEIVQVATELSDKMSKDVLAQAAKILTDLVTQEKLTAFLTLPCYATLNT